MNVEEVPLESLIPAPWATSHLLRPDERLMIQSLTDWGWLQPLVVRAENRTVIDGTARWLIAMNTPHVKERVGGSVPVVWVSCEEVDAMVMHVRLNRARGLVVAKRTSNLLKSVMASGKYDANTVRNLLVMTREEWEVMVDGSYLKQKSINEHTYSRGWVPVEAPKPGSVVAGEMRFERPVNRDN